MADKPNAGAQCPALTLDLVDGPRVRRVTLPDGIDTPYAVVLMYRGHW